MNTANDRYHGLPFLRLLDAYFFDLLGLLEESEGRGLEDVATEIAAGVGSKANTWQGIVEEVMLFDDQTKAATKGLWMAYIAEAVKAGSQIDAVSFVHMVSDSYAFPENNSSPR